MPRLVLANHGLDVDAVLFDAGGTLLRLDYAFMRACARRRDHHLPDEALARRYGFEARKRRQEMTRGRVSLLCKDLHSAARSAIGDGNGTPAAPLWARTIRFAVDLGPGVTRMLPSRVHPILFEFGAYEVPAYGAALSIAFIVSAWVAIRRGEQLGLSTRAFADLGLVIFASSLVGSRLLFALEQREILQAPLARWPELLNPIPATIGPGTPGLSMTGGVLLALAAALLVLKLRGLPVLRYADVAAPSVALGEAITRIGCFLNGCCGGTSCSLPWCVRFPGGNALVHPTQLYASLSAFLLFFGLLALARRRPTPGTITGAWLLGASAFRALVDVFRHYPEETQLAILGPLAIPAHVPVNLALFAIGLWLWRRSRADTRPAPR